MPSKLIVSNHKVRFSDGGSFTVRVDSAWEYIFHPVFMRFQMLHMII